MQSPHCTLCCLLASFLQRQRSPKHHGLALHLADRLRATLLCVRGQRFAPAGRRNLPPNSEKPPVFTLPPKKALLSCALSSFFEQKSKGAPFPAALQCQVDAWSEWSKPLFQLPSPKIRLICSPHIGDVSDIKLIRTDTTLDLSQKAEKR